MLFTYGRAELLCIQSIRTVTEVEGKVVPWNFSFTIKTAKRSLMLFAPTSEERDIWVECFNRLFKVPILDPVFN